MLYTSIILSMKARRNRKGKTDMMEVLLPLVSKCTVPISFCISIGLQELLQPFGSNLCRRSANHLLFQFFQLPFHVLVFVTLQVVHVSIWSFPKSWENHL